MGQEFPLSRRDRLHGTRHDRRSASALPGSNKSLVLQSHGGLQAPAPPVRPGARRVAGQLCQPIVLTQVLGHFP
ncbi:hypothetical protein C4K10_3326 [Pseudomonas chlororaphis subsp. aureofaciens]|nr:hypothetical protein C4K10_3326 [Pseudomonas chlororaphis subsp. aureofaciens]